MLHALPDDQAYLLDDVLPTQVVLNIVDYLLCSLVLQILHKHLALVDDQLPIKLEILFMVLVIMLLMVVLIFATT